MTTIMIIIMNVTILSLSGSIWLLNKRITTLEDKIKELKR